MSIPQTGSPNSTEQPKEASNFTTLQTVVNGNLDSTNIAASLAQSAGVNQSGQVSKGVCVNAGPGTMTSATYGNLSDAADQVTGIVLSTNGLIEIWYQATWKESVSGTARAAIFLNSSQMVVSGGIGSPQTVEASMASGAAGHYRALFSHPLGLASVSSGSGTENVDSSPQAVGFINIGSPVAVLAVGSTNETLASGTVIGGPCYLSAPAGTYTVSVKFKGSALDTVTAINRKLWVKAESFA